eukprot:gene12655-14960_t
MGYRRCGATLSAAAVTLLLFADVVAGLSKPESWPCWRERTDRGPSFDPVWTPFTFGLFDDRVSWDDFTVNADNTGKCHGTKDKDGFTCSIFQDLYRKNGLNSRDNHVTDVVWGPASGAMEDATQCYVARQSSNVNKEDEAYNGFHKGGEYVQSGLYWTAVQYNCQLSKVDCSKALRKFETIPSEFTCESKDPDDLNKLTLLSEEDMHHEGSGWNLKSGHKTSVFQYMTNYDGSKCFTVSSSDPEKDESQSMDGNYWADNFYGDEPVVEYRVDIGDGDVKTVDVGMPLICPKWVDRTNWLNTEMVPDHFRITVDGNKDSGSVRFMVPA